MNLPKVRTADPLLDALVNSSARDLVSGKVQHHSNTPPPDIDRAVFHPVKGWTWISEDGVVFTGETYYECIAMCENYTVQRWIIDQQLPFPELLDLVLGLVAFTGTHNEEVVIAGRRFYYCAVIRKEDRIALLSRVPLDPNMEPPTA